MTPSKLLTAEYAELPQRPQRKTIQKKMKTDWARFSAVSAGFLCDLCG
jgi:hypothetical protein